MRCLLLLMMLAAGSAAVAAGDTRTIDVSIQNRAVTTLGQMIRVKQGETVVLRWSSDEAVELHLHGYDVEVDVTAGSPAEMRFEATASGRFPVTSHGFAGERDTHGHGHKTLLYIEVYPE